MTFGSVREPEVNLFIAQTKKKNPNFKRENPPEVVRNFRNETLISGSPHSPLPTVRFSADDKYTYSERDGTLDGRIHALTDGEKQVLNNGRAVSNVRYYYYTNVVVTARCFLVDEVLLVSSHSGWPNYVNIICMYTYDDDDDEETT